MRFPFNQNLRFQFLVISVSQWNSIFQSFQKESNLIFLPEFLELSVEWFAIGNSSVLGISGNFSGKFLYQVLLFLKFSKVLVEWKAPTGLPSCVNSSKASQSEHARKLFLWAKGSVINARSSSLGWVTLFPEQS